MEVFHFPGSKGGTRYAKGILREMLDTFPGHKDRGVKEANYAVLRLTRMWAVLIECEFLTNPTQLKFLADRDKQKKMAVAIAEGISSVRTP